MIFADFEHKVIVMSVNQHNSVVSMNSSKTNLLFHLIIILLKHSFRRNLTRALICLLFTSFHSHTKRYLNLAMNLFWFLKRKDSFDTCTFLVFIIPLFTAIVTEKETQKGLCMTKHNLRYNYLLSNAC